MTAPTLPEVLDAWQPAAGHVLLHLRLPRDLQYFRGHFPEAPILPAVVQVDWAIHYAVERLKLRGAFRGMNRLKFRRVLQPLDEPRLELKYDAQAGVLDFSYSTPSGQHSSGELWLR